MNDRNRTRPNQNIRLVVNCDLGGMTDAVCKTVNDCVSRDAPLPEELADLFTLRILRAYNPDGSNRGILDWASD